MEDFVTFEIAKKLKEVGFPQHITDEAHIVDNYGEDEYDMGDLMPIQLIPDYIDDVAAPTISQVLKWMRDKKRIHICIDIYDNGWFFDVTSFYKQDTGVYEIELPYKSSNVTPDYVSYEEAALAGINYVLDFLI